MLLHTEPRLCAPAVPCQQHLIWHRHTSPYFRKARRGIGLQHGRRITICIKAMENGSRTGGPSPSWDRNADREERLWQRQEQLWAREMDRWDAERQAWAKREEFLVNQIAGLQALVVHLSTSQQSEGRRSSAGGRVAEPAALEEQRFRSLGATMRGAAEPHSPATEEEPISSAVDSQPPSPATPAPPERRGFDFSDMAALYERKGEEGLDLAANLAAAISAVELTDVLEDEAPYATVKAMTAAETSSTPSQQGATPVEELAVGPAPPTLAHGSDDIFWIAHLHAALDQQGFHSGDEEMEAWLFADQTMSALLTFQASRGLEETGVCDRDTWLHLLGLKALAERLAEAAKLGLGSEGSSEPAQPGPASGGSSDGVASSPEAQSAQAPAPAQQLKKWPVLHEGDGGQHVHALQAALNKRGYYCGEDDTVWWQFGMDTYSSLVTYQACNNLSETGVADAATWKSLLGPHAQPLDITSVRSGDSTDEDMQGTDRVWLLGEQRWEIRRS